MRTKIAFIPLTAWDSNITDCKTVFPDAVTYGSSKAVSYCYPKDNDKFTKMITESGIPFKMDKTIDEIISEITLGLNSIYNCELDVAWRVIKQFQVIPQEADVVPRP